MKKTLSFIIGMFSISLSAFAQNISYPVVARTDDPLTTITKIETNNQYTIISFENTPSGDSSWVQVNKEIYLQTDQNNAHYDFVKAENVSIAPAKHYYKPGEEKLAFKVFFKKIPATAKTLDIIERAGAGGNGVSYFNYYGVVVDANVKVATVTLSPPPPLNTADGLTQMFTDGKAGNFFSAMQQSVLDTQLNYYKQPGKLAEFAKLTKKYFDELVKTGFTNDQALKIITSDGIMSKISNVK